MRKLLIVIVTTFFTFHSAFAGWKENADSLTKVLDTSTADTAKMRLLIQLGKEVLSNTPDKSLEYFSSALKLSEYYNDTNYMVRSLLGSCSFYSRVNEYSTSFEMAYKALELARNNTRLLALCHNRLAEIHHMVEEFDVAIHHNHIALAYDRLNNDSGLIANDFYNMGTLYLEIDNFDSALFYLHAANKMSINSKGKPDIYSLSHIGLTYTYMEEYDSALHYHFKALRLDSLEGRNYEIAVDYYYIALTYFNIGNLSTTAFYAKLSNALAKKLGLFDILLLNYELMHQVSEKQGNYKDAYEYALLRNNFADSLRDKSNESLTLSLNAKYKFKENEQQLARAEERNHLLERQKTLLVILSVVSLLLLVSTVIIIRQINRRQKATRDLLEELEKANQSKEKLISVISHDLRGSIGTLRNAVELIIDDTMDYEAIKDLMKSFFPVVDSTYDLLENLLTWARYSKERLEPFLGQINIRTIVEKSIVHTNHIALSKDITIVNQVDNIIVTADKNMLSTVIRNLISNAVKFSAPGTQVTVSCLATNSLAEVKVSDNGIGIKESVLKNIFATPVDYHTKGTMGERGSGLGLSICKSFIESMDGRIWAESKPGKGSSFYFTLPVTEKTQ